MFMIGDSDLGKHACWVQRVAQRDVDQSHHSFKHSIARQERTEYWAFARYVLASECETETCIFI